MTDLRRHHLDAPQTFDARPQGPVTRMLVRLRDRLAAGSERRARASERPHEGWTS